MQPLKVRGRILDVDYYEELEPYLDRFNRVKLTGEKLISCSPFRPDTSPSFAVNLFNGTWIDSGSIYDDLHKGNFISLLSLLADQSREDTEDYLLDKYDYSKYAVNDLVLNMKLDPGQNHSAAEVKDPTYTPSRYLHNRGVSYAVQKEFKTCEIDDKIIIPWREKSGECVNAKYRLIEQKKFFYDRNGKEIRKLLFAADRVHKLKCRTIWIVEGEIDCLYLWTLNIPAVAIGGGSISEDQIAIIKSLEIDEVVIATDNDRIGHKLRETIKDALIGYVDVKYPTFPDGVKDINDMMPDQVFNMANNLKNFNFTFKKTNI